MRGFRWDWHPERATNAARRGAIEGLFRASEHILERANTEVPFQEGILKASGHTDIDEGHLVATVSYDTPYAIAQHEEVTFSHRHGRAKWLQLAFQEELGAVRDILARALRGEFNRERP